MAKQWKVKESEADQRLDVFLTNKIKTMTRSAIAKQLKMGAGSVNGKTAAVHAFLKVGDLVEFEQPNIRSAECRISAPLNVEGDIRHSIFDIHELIVKETPEWIVINKPAGLLVHPDSKHPDGTLVDLLVEYFSPLAKVGENPGRPGIVHRLDKDVSGLMVAAKTQDAFDDLKRQFAQRKTQKTYLALVYGSPPKDEGEIRFRIARSSQGGRMAARPKNEPGGKAAWTHYKVIRRGKNLTLLEVQIFSGRTHQIRAHLFALGCPVVGDTLYKSKEQRAARLSSPKTKFKIDRLMLQSTGLAFNDPASGARQSFSLSPDPAFSRLAP